MGLRKKILSRSGIEMEYWKINSWTINMGKKLMDITLVPYVDKDKRDEGLEPLNEEIRKVRIYDRVDKVFPEQNLRNYTDNFSPKALEESELDIYKMMYNYIKENVEEFEGAEDI